MFAAFFIDRPKFAFVLSIVTALIGATTFWGMLSATILGVAFIPPLYTLFQKAREKVKQNK